MPRRVVVIGAGHHGLVAGIRLAGRGLEVVVLEAADAPGGGVRSAELTLPGFVHDTCSGFFPLAAASPAFRELELGLRWVNPEVAMAHVFEDGAEIALHRDVGATADSLDACAPGAGDAWRRLVHTLWPHRDALVSAVLGRFPPLPAAAALLAGLRGRALRLAPLAARSSARIGCDLFGEARAAGWLAASGAHSDISPHAAPSGAFALGLNFLAHAVGWPFPRGGAAALTAALAARLYELGGELRCGAPVERIEPGAAIVRGGERLAADAVICTVSPGPLVDMLAPAPLPRRLRRWRYGLGTLKLDYALAGPVPWGAEAARRAGVVHVGGPLAEIAASLEQAKAGRFPERPALVLGQQSLHDPTRAPEGRQTLYAYARVPQRPGIGDAEMADRVEARIEDFAPGFRELVLERAVRSPAAIERENPSMRGGDLASGSFELDQQLFLRPHPRWFRYRTPLPGLYVAGAWVHPGAGVHGMSGRGAADAVLADLSSRRR
ncbi:MAG TPA: NAD(P)/FAD-dependent oxidoreductase [Candidatus Limnocylindria bacterium]|jgi:phytoene dehydrogenase-like protein|nr:NAD(P)/FAD-dependent oxidoreductase [Candidatus Limnocylindria bacterium]